MTKDGVLVVHHDEWLNPDTTRDATEIFCRSVGRPSIR